MKRSPERGRRDIERERQSKPHLVTFYDVSRIPKGEVFAFKSRPDQPMIKDSSGAVMSLAKYRRRYEKAEARLNRP